MRSSAVVKGSISTGDVREAADGAPRASNAAAVSRRRRLPPLVPLLQDLGGEVLDDGPAPDNVPTEQLPALSPCEG
jgi:hypothetical protein